jgi:hypothetical protein
MKSKTIQPDENRSTIQSDPVDTAAEAIKACSQQAAENKRMSISVVDSLLTLNARILELDQALKAAYGM